MNLELKTMIENVVKEDFPEVKNITFKQSRGNYKVLAKINNSYKHVLTVTDEGDILEYKETLCE
jgi:hypothetical protein